jgi:hypothetical protein
MAHKKGIKVEEPVDAEDKSDQEMKYYSADILTAHAFVNRIKASTEELQKIKNNVTRSYYGSSGIKELSQKLDGEMNEFMVCENSMSGLLKSLQERVKEAKDKDPVKLNLTK